MSNREPHVYERFIKPAFDKAAALVILLVLSPILLIVVLLLYINNGKVWFTQPRPGKHERIFKIIKFKTMTDQRDAAGNLLPDDVRLTSIGKFIRRTSLDELPQLLNVLKGDMSIVGPRPLLVEYLPLYNEQQRKRHLVKPGITGWAQINGRNTVAWKDRFALDVWYVQNISFAVDMRIIFATILKVLRAEGISGENTATMQKFKGNLETNP
jgi:undecaprenyl phosphate N,N'-diacetylbacillosamine 1-phosphate transferase